MIVLAGKVPVPPPPVPVFMSSLVQELAKAIMQAKEIAVNIFVLLLLNGISENRLVVRFIHF